MQGCVCTAADLTLEAALAAARNISASRRHVCVGDGYNKKPSFHPSFAGPGPMTIISYSRTVAEPA